METISTNEISQNKILGEGSFGVVFEGVWEGIPVAIKKIPKSDAKGIEQEGNTLKKCDHENVIKLLHVEEDKDFKYL